MLICESSYIHTDAKVRDHCHIARKYRGSAHREWNINSEFHHKIPILFYNLKHYDSDIIIQEIGRFNLKINAILNGLENYMSFSINNKLSIIDSFQLLSSFFSWKLRERWFQVFESRFWN